MKAIAAAAGPRTGDPEHRLGRHFRGLANGSYNAICSSVTITEERKQR
jgi:hypothetical protein